MKMYTVVYNFVEQLSTHLLLLAENEEEAVNAAYHAAYHACAWPKERVNIKGVWNEKEMPGGPGDLARQKKREKKYSVPFGEVEKNIGNIESRMGEIVDECILSSMTIKEDMARIKKKIDAMSRG